MKKIFILPILLFAFTLTAHSNPYNQKVTCMDIWWLTTDLEKKDAGDSDVVTVCQQIESIPIAKVSKHCSKNMVLTLACAKKVCLDPEELNNSESCLIP